MTINKALREAASNGRLHGLALWPSEQGWQANMRTKEGGWRVEIDADPVAAVLRAIGVSEMAEDEADVFG